jgi:putative DNA methylase
VTLLPTRTRTGAHSATGGEALRLSSRADLPATTLLEAAFPYAAVSSLVAADRRVRDSAYQAHSWWARRPSALVRAALVAAALPAASTPAQFRAAYASDGPLLDGWTVDDGFTGGGTTLVEAARLGAVARGRDVDPLAVLLASHQLDPAPARQVTDIGRALAEHLRAELGTLWPGCPGDDGVAWQPLHYFTVAVVTCPACDTPAPLYRSLVLARSNGKPGSVIRDQPVVAFCPDCLIPQSLAPGAKMLTCCHRRRPLDSSTYNAGRFHCPCCSVASSHEALQTGAAPRALIAVEETHPQARAARRRIRAAVAADANAEHTAARWLAARVGAPLPLERFIATAPGDRRPVSFGITTIGMLHSARQAAFFAAAHDWLDAAGLDDRADRALRLTVSSMVVSNNRLCGYATDYGRLAPLFSVRAFSLPTLAVELNPLNSRGGRGSLNAAVARVARSADDKIRRHVLDHHGRPRPTTLDLPRFRPGHTVVAADSATERHRGRRANICFTDPPYFDFIPYDTLSQVYRAWLAKHDLAGDPLLPCGDDPVADFGSRLGAALRRSADGLKPGAMLAFTYKGGRDAWDGVAVALDTAGLRVTGLWPVLADPHMGHHSAAGNCEYDMLLVARLARYAPASPTIPDIDSWLAQLPGPVSAADAANMEHAARIARERWGLPTAG